MKPMEKHKHKTKRTENREKSKNETIMKKMKTTIATTVALAACVSTPLFAQSTKEDKITFNMTVMQQQSVSTSTALDAGSWSQVPTHYKTQTKKMTQVDLLQAIAAVTHNNPKYYTSQASLVLVQGELGGFFNIDDALAQSYADFSQDRSGAGGYDSDGTTSDPDFLLTGYFNGDGTDFTFYDDTETTPYLGGDAADWPTFFPAGYDVDDISTYVDNDPITAIYGQYNDMYARLATGRHFLPVPEGYDTTGEYPPGHMQPWGQIFVKDPGHKDSAGDPLCENVTFFFYLNVQECYDCFYLNSFISDAVFTFRASTQSGPPCCTAPDQLFGKGTDKYYLTFCFDNTLFNGYLNPALYTNDDEEVIYFYDYVGFTGLQAGFTGQNIHGDFVDGVSPDLLEYIDPIRSTVGTFQPYVCRFTLNGIMTYSWNMVLVNKSDLYADFVGTGSYAYNGYGFIGLTCSLLTGSAVFSEKVVKDVGCCDDSPWYDTYYDGSGYDGWYGIGYDGKYGYFNPYLTPQINPYPYPNIVGGEAYEDLYINSLPDQNESPYNPAAALTHHTELFPELNSRGNNYIP
jgi:hypothetical protein